MSQGRDDRAGVPSNTELAQRTARIEEKIDHQSEQIEDLAETLEDDLEQQRQRIEEIQPQHQRLWITYQGARWILAIGSGGGVLALVVSHLL